MRKNVLVALAMIFLTVSSVSAQSFLKKAGDAAKKLIKTEESSTTATEVKQDNSLSPLSVTIVSTRIIGDMLLISGKVQASEDVRITRIAMSAITPDGNTYESRELWWGGEPTSTTTFDKNFITGISYAFDFTFDIKSKKITELTSLTFEARNWTAQANIKIPMKNVTVPSPKDPELSNPSVVEIYKNIYLRWTGAEEATDGLKINFVIVNKNDNDQKLQFGGFSHMKVTIIDSNGSSYEARGSLDCNTNFPADIPVAGSITVDKPLKVSQISLLEFSTRNYNYRIKEIVLPTR